MEEYGIINGKRVMINGRPNTLPSASSVEQIAREGGIAKGRMVIKRTREGNFALPSNGAVRVEEGDHFIDAPQRTKGS